MNVNKAEDAIVSLAMEATETKVLSGLKLRVILEALQKSGEKRMAYAQFFYHQRDCEKCDWPLFRCPVGEAIRFVSTDKVPSDVGES